MRTISILLAVVAIYSCGRVNAAGPAVSDTLTPAASSADAGKDEEVDLRLSQQVTYTARRKTVLAILTDLSRISGVTLNAGYNSNDWQVRDRRMNVFARDIPLLSLMNAMARVMKFKWSKSKEADPPTYRLYMDRMTMLALDAERRKEELEASQRTNERLAAIFQVADLEGQDLDALKKSNPSLYAWAASGTARALRGFFEAYPPAREMLARGEDKVINSVLLPQDVRDSLVELMRCNWRIMCPADKRFPEGTANLGRYRVRVNGLSREIEINAYGGGAGEDEFNGLLLAMSFPDHNRKGSMAWGRYQIALMENATESERKTILEDVNPAFREDDRIEATARVEKAEERQRVAELAEPESEPRDSPALAADVALTVSPQPGEKLTSLADWQQEIAKTTGYAVVSDSFGLATMSEPTGKRTVSLRSALDHIARTRSYNWWKRGSKIEFRDRDWLRKRALQIPEEWLERWRRDCKETGTISIDHMAEIATLTREQFEYNFRADETLKHTDLGRIEDDQRAVLDFYASLHPSQKRSLLSKSGLDLSRLSPDQRLSLWRAIGESLYNDYLDRLNELSDLEARFALVPKRWGGRYQYMLYGYWKGIRPDGEVVTKEKAECGYFFTPNYKPPEPKDAQRTTDGKATGPVPAAASGK